MLKRPDNVLSSPVSLQQTEDIDAKRQKLARYHPSLPSETFHDVSKWLDRDTLDSVMLVCRFMSGSVRALEDDHLALRAIALVSFGKLRDNDCGEEACRPIWMPNMRVSLERSAKELFVNCLRKATPYLRLSYCNVVDVELRGLTLKDKEDLRGVILDDLVLEHAFVGRLNVFDERASADVFMRVIEAFESLESVALDWQTGNIEQPDSFSDKFFGSLAQRGVLTCDFRATDSQTAIAACEFLRVTGCVECRLFLGDYALIDDFEIFLLKLLEKPSKIEMGTRADFTFLIDLTSYFDDHDLDDAGFIEYANHLAMNYTASVWTMGNRWVIDDLENDIKLEIELFAKVEAACPSKMLQIEVCSTH